MKDDHHTCTRKPPTLYTPSRGAFLDALGTNGRKERRPSEQISSSQKLVEPS